MPFSRESPALWQIALFSLKYIRVFPDLEFKQLLSLGIGCWLPQASYASWVILTGHGSDTGGFLAEKQEGLTAVGSGKQPKRRGP